MKLWNESCFHALIRAQLHRSQGLQQRLVSGRTFSVKALLVTFRSPNLWQTHSNKVISRYSSDCRWPFWPFFPGFCGNIWVNMHITSTECAKKWIYNTLCNMKYSPLKEVHIFWFSTTPYITWNIHLSKKYISFGLAILLSTHLFQEGT